MPVRSIEGIIPKHTRVLKNAVNQQAQQPRKVINSFEFHAGFIPPKHKDDPVKVQHFIDSLI